ncbi:MAG: ribosomal protein S18-alanine N-acetyltransferase [Anaerolineae bacterium]|nr:ribosomal protein S18-alanine N-acetyltransferase [Anaerolineae bacterium]
MENESAQGQEKLSFRIRRMRLEDIPQVVAIDQVSFSLPWSERSFRFELTQNQNSRSWVCESVSTEGTTKIVGMMVIWLVVDEAHVATIAVDPAYRRRSLARRLLAYGLLELFEEGARVSHLEVRRGNVAAQRLYYEFGYEEVGIRPRYYKDNFEDAILMTLPEIQPEHLKQILRG